jgi:hypothetical protein
MPGPTLESSAGWEADTAGMSTCGGRGDRSLPWPVGSDARVALQLRQLITAEHILFTLAPPCHSGAILASSPIIRLH